MPKFAKRHYEAVAEAVKRASLNAFQLEGETPLSGAKRQRDQIMMELAQTFYRDNPLFKPSRFYRACSEEGSNA